MDVPSKKYIRWKRQLSVPKCPKYMWNNRLLMSTFGASRMFGASKLKTFGPPRFTPEKGRRTPLIGLHKLYPVGPTCVPNHFGPWKRILEIIPKFNVTVGNLLLWYGTTLNRCLLYNDGPAHCLSKRCGIAIMASLIWFDFACAFFCYQNPLVQVPFPSKHYISLQMSTMFP